MSLQLNHISFPYAIIIIFKSVVNYLSCNKLRRSKTLLCLLHFSVHIPSHRLDSSCRIVLTLQWLSDLHRNHSRSTILKHQGGEHKCKHCKRNEDTIQTKNEINCQWNRGPRRSWGQPTIIVIGSQVRHIHHHDTTSAHHLHHRPTPPKIYTSLDKRKSHNQVSIFQSLAAVISSRAC